MNIEKIELLILVKLLVAHFLSDFVIQPDKWVESRQIQRLKSPYLYIHSFIAGVLSYILIGNWGWVHILFIVFAVHLLIDVLKVKINNSSVQYFMLDQVFHIISILIIWLFFISAWSEFYIYVKELFLNLKVMLIATAYVVILWPSGILIRELTGRWRRQISSDSENSDSLANAGKWIGFLERFLVLTFVLINQFGAIGFLIAAKSILRLNPGDKDKTRKYSEYVLLGTLISFTVSILVGLLINNIT